MDDRARPAWAGRLDKVQSSLSAQGHEALVVSTPINVTYLTGFKGSAGLLLVTPAARVLIVDGRYEFAARQGVARATIAATSIERVEKRYDLTLGAVLVAAGLRRVAFEAGTVTVATLGAWQRAAPGVEWISTERLVEKVREIKDATEIETLRRGGVAIANVARHLSQIVARDRTEQDVAERLDRAIRDAGFERVAFDTIVASGPNSALAHARPGPRRLSEGDLVVLDFGGVLDGYCVDLTRMAAVGQVAPAARRLYEGVRAANAAAIAAVRPGIETSAIDAAARTVLEALGLGEAFLHATGHGLGLEVHEAPRLARRDPESTEIVENGMVFTIEPGAYVEGVGGVRLEDDVLVTTAGAEVLTDVPRDLLVV